MTNLIYFSNVTQNTHRFVCDLGIDAMRIPLVYKGETLALEPFVLITPTYGLGKGDKNFVPPQVRKFLNNADNSSLLRGVIAAGNANFGEEFALAGKIISKRFDVPYLYRFELRGNDADVKNIRAGLEMFWTQQEKIENNQDAVLGV